MVVEVDLVVADLESSSRRVKNHIKIMSMSVEDDVLAKEDPGTILRCMAENYQAGEEQIKACRQCFQVSDASDWSALSSDCSRMLGM